jgi:hypothetical protein
MWFVAAFEDGKETPSFLVCWVVAVEAALGDAGADESPRELGRNPPFGSEEQVNAYVVEQLKALSERVSASSSSTLRGRSFEKCTPTRGTPPPR